MKKIFFFLLALTICSQTYALKPVSESKARIMSAQFSKRTIARSEVRANDINVLDIGFTEPAIMETLLQELKDLGFNVHRFSTFTRTPVKIMHSFDFVFWDMMRGNDIRLKVMNLNSILRPDGVAFLKVDKAKELDLELELRLQEMDLKKDGGFYIVKRHWESWAFFKLIAQEFTSILAMQKAA